MKKQAEESKQPGGSRGNRPAASAGADKSQRGKSCRRDDDVRNVEYRRQL